VGSYPVAIFLIAKGGSIMSRLFAEVVVGLEYGENRPVLGKSVDHIEIIKKSGFWKHCR
jgi:hypothetical protein